MTTAASAVTAETKQNSGDRIGSDKNVSSGDVRWTPTGGRELPVRTVRSVRVISEKKKKFKL